MESIDIMESQPNEDPRQPKIPSQHPRPSLMMTTLESFLGNAFRKKLNLIQEDEPIFHEQIEVGGGKQPLIIYSHDNYEEVVSTFCRFNEISQDKSAEILEKVKKAL